MAGSQLGPDQPDELLPVWVAIALVIALIVGMVAGLLAWSTGDVPARATLTGGGAFAGTATLGILLIVTLRRRPRQ